MPPPVVGTGLLTELLRDLIQDAEVLALDLQLLAVGLRQPHARFLAVEASVATLVGSDVQCRSSLILPTRIFGSIGFST